MHFNKYALSILYYATLDVGNIVIRKKDVVLNVIEHTRCRKHSNEKERYSPKRYRA